MDPPRSQHKMRTKTRWSTTSTMAPVENTSKKARLTIAQLAAYDDVLTDVLIDHVCISLCCCRIHADWFYRSSPGTRPARTWGPGKYAISNIPGESMRRTLRASCSETSSWPKRRTKHSTPSSECRLSGNTSHLLPLIVKSWTFLDTCKNTLISGSRSVHSKFLLRIDTWSTSGRLGLLQESSSKPERRSSFCAVI